jgi:hypothetical protein
VPIARKTVVGAKNDALWQAHCAAVCICVQKNAVFVNSGGSSGGSGGSGDIIMLTLAWMLTRMTDIEHCRVVRRVECNAGLGSECCRNIVGIPKRAGATRPTARGGSSTWTTSNSTSNSTSTSSSRGNDVSRRCTNRCLPIGRTL